MIRDLGHDYWTGTVYTTNRRVWEHDEAFKEYLRAMRCMAIDMETATMFAAGFANRIPCGALLLVSRPADDARRREDRSQRREASARIRRAPHPDRDRGAAADPPPRQVGAAPAVRRMRTRAAIDAADVVAFWRDAGPSKWFCGGAAFDANAKRSSSMRISPRHARELDAWMDDGGRRARAGDAARPDPAQHLPRHARTATRPIRWRGITPLARSMPASTTQIDPVLRVFFYLPFEHSEDLDDQQRAVALTRRWAMPATRAMRSCIAT